MIVLLIVLIIGHLVIVARGVHRALREHKVNDAWAFDALLLALTGLSAMVALVTDFVEGIR